MKLIIAEKPSQAQSYAGALKIYDKKDGYFEGGEYIISWAFGHLVALAPPSDYDEKYEVWCIEDLPILPDPFLTVPAGDGNARKQFRTLCSLMKRGDVDEVICATDADREGELIFRLIYEQAGCKKPIKRLWTSSLEDEAILTALKKMKSGSEYEGLADAARGRQRADWIIGMNFTRLYTCLYRSKLGYGRVQSPTLSAIVIRQREIDNFVPVPYYNVTADFGDFSAVCRLDEKTDAEALAKRCVGKTGVVSRVEKKNKKDKAPTLYNLTSLQKDASKIFGYSAKQTLEAAQSLYEKQLSTYPRTDSSYLTQEEGKIIGRVIDAILGCEHVPVPGGFDLSATDESVLVNDKKVESHHAIIPTVKINSKAFEGLSEREQNVLMMICYRVLVAISRPYVYISTVVDVDLEDHVFTARGKQIVDMGWKEVHEMLLELAKKKKPKKGKDADEEEDGEDVRLPELFKGDTRKCVKCEPVEKFTKPPSAYTEETLLEFMATAGRKEVEDAEMAEAMTDGKGKWKGLGTSATRADIIEKIIKNGYVERKGKKLVPTDMAYVIVDAADPRVIDPLLTAEWEYKLAEIEHGEAKLEDFITEINRFCSETVANACVVPELAERFGRAKAPKAICICPRCGESVVAKKKKYECSSNKYIKNDDGTFSRQDGCGFSLWPTVAGKKLSESNIKALCEKGQTGVIKGFTSKTGKSFDAKLELVDDGDKAGCKFIFDDGPKKPAAKAGGGSSAKAGGARKGGSSSYARGRR